MSSESLRRGYLLDTHMLIWALKEPERLSDSARTAILAGPCFLSVISYWEAVIKSMQGGIHIGEPRTWWAEALAQLDAKPLHLNQNHVAELSALPPIHKDPFDRMLIAQAIAEKLALVSMDAEVARYTSVSLRVIG